MKKSLKKFLSRRRGFSAHSNEFIAAGPCPARRALAFACALLALAIATPACAATGDNAWQSLPYQLGQGLYFPQQGLRIGGYTSIHYYDLERQPAALNVHDLSLFLTKRIGARWQLFSEVEVGDALTVTADHTTTRDAEFDVERLYADYHARQGVTLRFGKFLTPVGQWNLIHADPLVWTVTRPLTTSAAFARHSSGAAMYGSLPAGDNDLDYWLFVDDSETLNPSQRRELAFSSDGASSLLENNFNRAAGGHLLYHLFDNRLSVGVSYLHFELEHPQQKYRLTGLDFTWSSDHAELTGEAIYRTVGDSGHSDEHGGFLQAVIPLTRRLHLVGRYEKFQTAILPQATTLSTAGINYRLRPGVSFKLERRQGTDNDRVAPDGWLGSFAVLF